MDYREIYKEWLDNPYFDDATKAELKAIADDEKEIEERFYMDLEFGTAGLRGIIGAGTNRMNVYTVRKATQGLANYISAVRAREKGVAIAYDSRRMSPEFADVAALCLAGLRALDRRKPLRAMTAAFLVHNLLDTSFFYLGVTALVLTAAGCAQEEGHTLGGGGTKVLFALLAGLFAYGLYYTVTAG